MSTGTEKVLIRVDFNVPLDADGNVTDATRILRALPTIRSFLEKDHAVILMSHLGRPLKKLKSDGTIDVDKYTLRHILPALEEALDKNVKFASSCIGEEPENMTAELEPGDVLLLENTRFHAGETRGDHAFAKALARLGDRYVNDAFGTAHRAHASTAVIAQFYPPGKKEFGLLMKEEIRAADQLLSDHEKPFIVVLGGVKVSDKIGLIDRFIDPADHILIGGAMAYTFIKAKGGSVGNSLVEDDKLELARELLSNAEAKACTIHLPDDSIVAREISNSGDTKTASSNQIASGWMGLDIGPAARSRYERIIETARTILWNGPMGVFEIPAFEKGTFAMAHAIADATRKGAFSLVGGGDSVAAVNRSGEANNISFISTGGGAMLEYLEGKTLPGIAAITAE